MLQCYLLITSNADRRVQSSLPDIKVSKGSLPHMKVANSVTFDVQLIFYGTMYSKNIKMCVCLQNMLQNMVCVVR